MRIVVCVKWVPVLSQLRFDPETKRLARDGIPGEPSSFDVRALLGALALREQHGGEVVVVTMGPEAATDGLRECLALGADRALLLSDPALAGSDTLATARALAGVMRREQPDLVLLGKASVDAETGQVGPELAELIDLPQATNIRRITLNPGGRWFDVERDTDDGTESLRGSLPAVLTAGEDLAPERFPNKAQRQAALEKPLARFTLADIGVSAAEVGAAGSPTWVAGVEEVPSSRAPEMLVGDTPEAVVAELRARLLARGALVQGADDRPALSAAGPRSGPPLWVVVELAADGQVRPVTAELLAKANGLAGQLGGSVEAIVLGHGDPPAVALAAAGADRILVASDPGLTPYTTDAHTAVLAAAIRAHQPRLVLFGSTSQGRDLAPRVAARLGLGLTGDAVDLDVDAEGRIRQLKPAFGGAIVAPILSNTRPEMATVRPGILRAAKPDPTRQAPVEWLAVTLPPARVQVTGRQALTETEGGALDVAAMVLGLGHGLGGAEQLKPYLALASQIEAAVCTTRDVSDDGWLPRQLQVGITGRAIAPRLYVALGIRGAMEHMVGVRGAGTIVAINTSAKAPIFKSCDLGIVGDAHVFLPLLATALRA
jgi:electron transfer flavoprotein alpha subunit